MDFSYLAQHAGEYATTLSHVITAASIVAAVVPGAQGASVALQLARKVLDGFAMNWGNAANAQKPPGAKPVS